MVGDIVIGIKVHLEGIKSRTIQIKRIGDREYY